MATPERLIIESLFRIADKEGNDVDFKLNPAQARLDTYLTGRDIIPKARQEGISSYYLARFTAKCLYKRNTRAVVISHDKETTQRMMAKVHYFLNNLRGPSAVIKNASKNEITFPKTNSMFYIGTAGSRQFGRGDTITDLHCSEVAYWPDPKKLLSGLFQAVPKTGEIAIESTGNGVGNYYHRACMKAWEGKSQYRCHFFSWTTFPEYKLDLTEEEREAFLASLEEEFEEPQLLERGLSVEQLAWRRMKLEELDYDLRLFKQEYPMTIDECFQASGHSIFHRVNFVNKKNRWKRESADLHVLADHPRDGIVYVLGVDVGGGVGKDNSVIQIVDAKNHEQVGEWASNRLAPDVLAEKVIELAYRFNQAYIGVESNNHGIVTLKELLDRYPKHLIHRGEVVDSILDYGIRTTAHTKPMMLGHLRKVLAQGFKVHSPLLNSELSTFIEKANGKMEADEGCLDDRVMALSMAVWVMDKALAISERPAIDESFDPHPFSLEGIIGSIGAKRQGYPIRDQNGIMI